MQTVACPHCSEPIRPTATFCLACDRPVVDTDRGLSVAEPVTGSVGRPLVGVAVALACVAVLGGTTYGGVRIYQNAHTALSDQARSDVRRGLELVVAAEDGQASACRSLGAVVAQPAATTLSECRAILGDDKGARLDGVTVGTPHLAKGVGTVAVTGTVTDGDGSRPIDRTVRLFELRRHWRMVWDGQPEASTHRS